MERPAPDGQLIYAAGDYDYWVATRDDEPAVRGLLARFATGGIVQLSLRREPDAFTADFGSRAHDYILARNRRSGDLVGLCERVVRDTFMNGELRALPYLAGLRVVPNFRHRLLVLRGGFEALRRLIGVNSPHTYALTSIMSDNVTAKRMLGANLRGMPRYEPAGEFATFALAPGGAVRAAQATAADLPEIAALLLENAARTQFAAAWTLDTLQAYAAAGWLRPEDYFVIRRDGRIRACAAVWDQSAHRQVIVAGYSRWLARTRHLVNAGAKLLGIPRLPAPGEPLRCAYFSHVGLSGQDDAADLGALLDSARHEIGRRGIDTLLAGWAANDGLCNILRQRARRREYRSQLYLVRWPETPAPALDATRRVAPELALL
jgi:hypothetical protein